MGLVTLNISMSVDGFVAGTNIGHDHPLGVHGERLHDWLFLGAESAGPDRDVQDSYFASTGAFVMGRRMFDVGLPHWGDNGAFGKPCFVLTHRGQDTLVKGPTSFNFVTNGVLSCLEQAKAAAGDRSVCVVGGATAAQQFLAAGLIDEMHIHLAHVLLGAGTRLFDNSHTGLVSLDRTELIASPHAAHFVFRIVK